MDASASRHRLIAGLTAIAGLVALGVTVAFRLLPEVKAAGGCMPADAVVRFEFARENADVPFLYGVCQAQAKAAVDAVNHLDVAAYIPSYNAFAALAAVFLARTWRGPLVMLAILAALVAFVADYVETITLLRITADFDGAGPLFATSSAAAWTKFVALGANAGLLSAICLTTAPRRLILGVLLALPVLATVVLLLDPHRSDLLSYAYLASWTPVLVLAAREALVGVRR
jgi:hypothetical protein